MPRAITHLSVRENSRLPPMWETAACALASGRTMAIAAESAGVSRSAVQRWLADPRFVCRVNQLRAEMTQQVIDATNDAMITAMATLVNLCHPSNPPSFRLAAAGRIFDLGIELRRLSNLELRLQQLEEGHQQTQREPHYAIEPVSRNPDQEIGGTKAETITEKR